jgi:hypothetical protein
MVVMQPLSTLPQGESQDMRTVSDAGARAPERHFTGGVVTGCQARHMARPVALAARPPRGATLIAAVTLSPSATRSCTRTPFFTGST